METLEERRHKKSNVKERISCVRLRSRGHYREICEAVRMQDKSIFQIEQLMSGVQNQVKVCISTIHRFKELACPTSPFSLLLSPLPLTSTPSYLHPLSPPPPLSSTLVTSAHSHLHLLSISHTSHLPTPFTSTLVTSVPSHLYTPSPFSFPLFSTPSPLSTQLFSSLLHFCPPPPPPLHPCQLFPSHQHPTLLHPPLTSTPAPFRCLQPVLTSTPFLPLHQE